MISFRRTKKRNYRNPADRYLRFGIMGAFALLLVLTFTVTLGRNRLNSKLADTREMIAAAIQSDMNEILQASSTIEHRGADLAGHLLPTMKRHMYSASTMNDILVDAFGDEYSMIVPEQYEQFQSIMEQFDQLLATGQSTEAAKAALVACTDQMEAALLHRFTADGGLLPRTALSSAQPQE